MQKDNIIHMNDSIIFKLFFIITVLLFLLMSTGCINTKKNLNDNNTYEVKVSEVIDGDTIYVIFPNESKAIIRFLGIDCPETSIKDNIQYEYHNISNLSCLTYYGNKAKTYVESILNNSVITITFDKQTSKKDQYDRFLCYVSKDTVDINAHLVENGYARVYTLETFSRESMYVDIQNDAIKQSKGLWNCTDSNMHIFIAKVHYNAAGNDKENLNDEYIVLVNNDKKILDLTGWSIKDTHGNQFRFPFDFSLPAQSSVTIYTGSGVNMSTALYWHHQTPVWNNDGDSVFVYDEKNVLQEEFSW